MAEYIVQPGDWLSKIAPNYGMTWEELYYHENNAPFRALRPDPNLIYPGDVLWVPDPPAQSAGAITLQYTRPAASNDGTIHPDLHLFNPHLYSYKVKTGDSLESIAAAIGINWQQLALLNWDTDDPDRINWYLGTYFVCKTKAGVNYVFTSTDEPGILMLPQPLDVVTGQRVRAARASRFPI